MEEKMATIYVYQGDKQVSVIRGFSMEHVAILFDRAFGANDYSWSIWGDWIGVPEHETEPFGNYRVMSGGDPEIVGSVSVDIGSVNDVFGKKAERIKIWWPKGPCDKRNCREYWPLTIQGILVGELRDDANGLTVHLAEDAETRSFLHVGE